MAVKMPRLAMNDVAYMRETVFFEGERFRERVSRFWILLVLASVIAAAAVGIALLIGLLLPIDVVAQNNSQVAARVHPRLIDLLAALGTGVVGSIALVRRDISDALPGVAIAISLVPPLSVVGLTLEAASVQAVSERWATDAGWRLTGVTTDAANTVVVSVEGALPLPDTTLLEDQLRSAELDPAPVRVVLTPTYTVDY